MAKIVGTTDFRRPKLFLSSAQPYDSVDLVVNAVTTLPIPVTTTYERNMYDNSPELNNVQMKGGAAQYVTDRPTGIGDYALSVQATQRLNLIKDTPVMTACTIQFWIKLDTANSTSTFPVVQGALTDYLDMSIKGHKVVKVFGTNLPANPLELEHFNLVATWTHVVCMLSAGMGYLYVGGVLIWAGACTKVPLATKLRLFGSPDLPSLPAKVSDFVICGKTLYEVPDVPDVGVDIIPVPTAPTSTTSPDQSFMKLMLPLYNPSESVAVDDLSVDPPTDIRSYVATFKNGGTTVDEATLTITLVPAVTRASISRVDVRIVEDGQPVVYAGIVGNSLNYEDSGGSPAVYDGVILPNPAQGGGTPTVRAVLRFIIVSNKLIDDAHLTKKDGASWVDLGFLVSDGVVNGVYSYHYDLDPWPTTFYPEWDATWATLVETHAIKLGDGTILNAFKTGMRVNQLF